MEKRMSRLAWVAGVLLVAGAGLMPVRAQLAEPLRVGNVHPLTDVFERKLDGPAYSARARVDVFTVRPNRQSVFLTNTYVGADASPGKGYFSLKIAERPATNIVLRAVAYDAASSNEASYFRSASARVPATGRLLLDFGEAKPMAKFGSAADAAYAAAYSNALDRLHASGTDSDGDGMTDWEEVKAGTAIDDGTSLLAFESIKAPQSDATPRKATDTEPVLVEVKWQSVPDHAYQLQYTPSLVPGEVAWEDIGDIQTAYAGDTNICVEVELQKPEAALGGHFRLKLVPLKLVP
jgi:hypothetical protein